jgi:hypothetical protein
VSTKRERMAAYRAMAFVALAGAVTSGLIGIWAWSQQWGLQAAVLAVVAFVLAILGVEM